MCAERSVLINQPKPNASQPEALQRAKHFLPILQEENAKLQAEWGTVRGSSDAAVVPDGEDDGSGNFEGKDETDEESSDESEPDEREAPEQRCREEEQSVVMDVGLGVFDVKSDEAAEKLEREVETGSGRTGQGPSGGVVLPGQSQGRSSPGIVEL